MPLRLVRDKVQEIPFGPGRQLRVQIGFLEDAAGERKFRYSRSLEKIRSNYRITIQFLPADETYTPYVFDLVPNGDAFTPRPDNDDATTLWHLSNDPRRKSIQEAIDVIIDQDLATSR